jgi:hypothetical protein
MLLKCKAVAERAGLNSEKFDRKTFRARRMPRACSDRASMYERFSTGWGTNRWRQRCGIWCRPETFTTRLIRLSYPLSLRTKIRQGSPFNWKSIPAEEQFVSTIDSRDAGSFRWAAPTRKMSLELSVCAHPAVSPVLGGRVSGNRRFSVQFASASGANHCPVRKRTWDSLAGLGPGGASCAGAARVSSAVHLGQTLPGG